MTIITDNHDSLGYCGNKLNGDSRQVNTESALRCDDPAFVCAGDSTEFCGGYRTFGFVCSRHTFEHAEADTNVHSTPKLVRHQRPMIRMLLGSSTSSTPISPRNMATTFTSDAITTRTVYCWKTELSTTKLPIMALGQ